MVAMFRGCDGYNSLCVLAIFMNHLILELSALLSQLLKHLCLLLVVYKAILDGQEVMVMLLIKGIGVGNGLNRGVVILRQTDDNVSELKDCQDIETYGLG